ncbi:MAG: hypothetical protein FJ319_07390 [SAR202 cluster bacterium]|nr:hypothetical protein [SAR202 cluster bacterium]
MKYVAKKTAPGSYPNYDYSGPRPTSFKESPMSAALVKAGKLPPLEQRLPVPEDIYIIPPTDEIGVYGGTMRMTLGSLKPLDHMTTISGMNAKPDGVTEPRLFKSFEISPDGRVHTFKIRRGVRWSDGYPFTMENIRFALEDLQFNKELVPTTPDDLRSPLTGKDPKFTVVDANTFTLAWDDPYFSFEETRFGWSWTMHRGCPSCAYAPAHILKRYHPKYNAAEIPALLEKWKQPDWIRMFTAVRNIRGQAFGIPTGTIPNVADPNYIFKGDLYHPTVGELVTTFIATNERRAERNHFFWGVDPEGNQLPYIDGQVNYALGNRDAAIFRAMNGENDYLGQDMILSELPLYLANMEKGDYSVYIFRSPGGGDANIAINQEHTINAELGKLLRTKEFRIALSLAWDREGTNDTAAGGIGTPQNWVPHPDTAYYPGDQFRTLDATFDLARAKQLIKGIGYEDKDGDGFLDKREGTGPLTMYLEASGSGIHWPYVELAQKYWAAIGIKLDIKDGSTVGAQAAQSNPTQYFNLHTSLYEMNPWSVYWNRQAPLTYPNPISPDAGKYFQTFGKEGLAPTGGDAKYADAKNRIAPASTYAPDINGSLKKMQDIWNDGKKYARLSPQRIDIGKDFHQIAALEKFNIGTIAYAGIDRGIQMKRNNLRNVPKNHVTTESGGILGVYYFENGIDNMNHTGNRSKRYKSISFLDPAYWD